MITREQMKMMKDNFPGVNDPNMLEDYISEVLDVMQATCEDYNLKCKFDDEKSLCRS